MIHCSSIPDDGPNALSAACSATTRIIIQQAMNAVIAAALDGTQMPDVPAAKVTRDDGLRVWLSPRVPEPHVGTLWQGERLPARAKRRGRELPSALAQALVALASQAPDGGVRMTRTLSAVPSTNNKVDQTLTQLKLDISSQQSSAGMARAPIATPRMRSSSLTPYEPRDSTLARTAPDEAPRSFSENSRQELVESELMPSLKVSGGKPGQSPTVRAIERAVTQSPSLLRSGSGNAS